MKSISTQGILARLYVNILLADERAADEVWELWDTGVITDEMAALAWWPNASGQISVRPLSAQKPTLS